MWDLEDRKLWTFYSYLKDLAGYGCDLIEIADKMGDDIVDAHNNAVDILSSKVYESVSNGADEILKDGLKLLGRGVQCIQNGIDYLSELIDEKNLQGYERSQQETALRLLAEAVRQYSHRKTQAEYLLEEES